MATLSSNMSDFSDPPVKTQAVDNNDHIVERSYMTLDESGTQVWRSILPQGYVYDEKIETQSDNAQEYDSWSEASSDRPDDNDGHDECGKGGFHSCHDNPKNIYLQEGEDHSVNARYVEWNSVSETGLSEFSKRVRPRMRVSSQNMREMTWNQTQKRGSSFVAGRMRKMTAMHSKHRN
jgi:hypothetical protein